MKKSVVSLVLAAVSCPALPADSPVDRLVGCADIRDSRERLACFDREVAPLATARVRQVPAPPIAQSPVAPTARTTIPAPVPAPATAPSPVAVPPAAAPAQAATPAASTPSFGEEMLQPKSRKETPAEQEILHARIERIRKVTENDFIVYLDNGQAWRHQDAVLGGYLRQGEAISISRGTLGSYRLTRDAGAGKNWIRVTRIK